MQDIVGTILGVLGRQSKNGQHTMYDVQFSDGNKYTTFDPGLAQRAQTFVGQPNVTLRVEVVQNGKYTNYNLEDLAPAGQALPPLAVPPAVAGSVPLATPPVGAALPPAIPMASGNGLGPADIERIARSTAISAAATFLGHKYSGAADAEGAPKLGDVFQVAEAVKNYILTGGAVPTQQFHPAPATVAETVNAEAGAPVVGVGAAPEPVEPTQKDDIPW